MLSLEITRFPEPDYAYAEALNTLCTNLSFAGDHIRKIMLTSCRPTEGKSFLSMGLLRALGRLGKNVVLVDADLRRSAIKTQFGVKGANATDYGLAHYLAGMCDIEDVVYATDLAPNAYLVPIGREVANSLPLLNSPRLAALLDWLARRFEFVLIDTPPVGVIIDAAEIARFCDGVLFVVSYNQIARSELAAAKAQIVKSGTPILGAVLNNVDTSNYMNKKYYNKYYYNRYYSAEGAAYDTQARQARARAKRGTAKG